MERPNTRRSKLLRKFMVLAAVRRTPDWRYGHAGDDCCTAGNPLGLGTGIFLYHGRTDPRSVGDRRRGGIDPTDFGKAAIESFWR
jgi:hypothetical protein